MAANTGSSSATARASRTIEARNSMRRLSGSIGPGPTASTSNGIDISASGTASIGTCLSKPPLMPSSTTASFIPSAAGSLLRKDADYSQRPSPDGYPTTTSSSCSARDVITSVVQRGAGGLTGSFFNRVLSASSVPKPPRPQDPKPTKLRLPLIERRRADPVLAGELHSPASCSGGLHS